MIIVVKPGFVSITANGKSIAEGRATFNKCWKEKPP